MNLADALRVLGIAAEASQEEARKAYLALIKVHKPDRDPAGFRRIRAAFECVIERGASPEAGPAHPNDASPSAVAVTQAMGCIRTAELALARDDTARAVEQLLCALDDVRRVENAASWLSWRIALLALELLVRECPDARRVIDGIVRVLEDTGAETELAHGDGAVVVAVLRVVQAVPEAVDPTPLRIIADGLVRGDLQVDDALSAFGAHAPSSATEMSEILERIAPDLAAPWIGALRDGRDRRTKGSLGLSATDFDADNVKGSAHLKAGSMLFTSGPVNDGAPRFAPAFKADQHTFEQPRARTASWGSSGGQPDKRPFITPVGMTVWLIILPIVLAFWFLAF